MEVLDLYRTALVQEDIDQLQALLRPVDTLDQPGVLRFLETMAHAFRTSIITDLQIPAETIQITATRQRVMFQEIVSFEDSTLLAQRTHVFRTTLQLIQDKTAGVVTFRIAGVHRAGPLVQITTLG
jgi:hypothetical protein